MYSKKIPIHCLLILGLAFSTLMSQKAWGETKASPRLMVIIEERLSEVPPSLTAENAMIKELLAAGFLLADPEQAKKLRKQVRAEILSQKKINKEALKKIGEDLNCDLIIAGTAVADHFASSGPVKAYVSSLDIRILSTSTAQILATLSTKAKGRGYEAGPAIRTALEKAALSATKDLLAKNTLAIQPHTKLFLIGLSDNEARKLALTLSKELEADVKLLYSSRDLSEIEIAPGANSSPSKIVDALKKTKTVSLNILQRSGHKIVAQRKSKKKQVSKAKQPRPPVQKSLLTEESGFSSGDLLIKSVHLQNIYPARLLNYSKAFAEAAIVNTSATRTLKNIKIRIYTPEFMSVPAEKILPELGPGKDVVLTLPAIFDRDKLYRNQQPKKTNTKVTIAGDGIKKASKNFETDIYGRRAMNWKDPSSIMNFVTPTDPVIKDFTSLVLSRVDLTSVQPCMVNIHKASAIFSALSSIPVRYSTDPNPDYFQKTLDYVQFPRETLQRKTGDCDDTSVLFASCLESIGIPTRFVVTQDHIFLEFNTGMSVKAWSDIIFDKERFYEAGDSLWIPLEMTKFCMEGRCFFDAWTEAANRYKGFQKKDALEKIAFSQESSLYPSFPLPEPNARQAIILNDLQVRVAESMNVLYKEREAALDREKKRLEKEIRKTSSLEAKNKLGILLCKAGLIKKARKQFLSILKEDNNNAKARHNLGNIYLMKNKFSEAIDQYKSVSEYGKDPEVLYNMGVAYFLTEDKDRAEDSLRTAYSNLSGDREEKKVAWMLGVSDLKHEKMSLSQPRLEAFKSIIYKVIPDKQDLKGSPSQGSRLSASSQKNSIDLSEVLWWKF